MPSGVQFHNVWAYACELPLVEFFGRFLVNLWFHFNLNLVGRCKNYKLTLKIKPKSRQKIGFPHHSLHVFC